MTSNATHDNNDNKVTPTVIRDNNDNKSAHNVT